MKIEEEMNLERSIELNMILYRRAKELEATLRAFVAPQAKVKPIPDSASDDATITIKVKVGAYRNANLLTREVRK